MNPYFLNEIYADGADVMLGNMVNILSPNILERINNKLQKNTEIFDEAQYLQFAVEATVCAFFCK